MTQRVVVKFDDNTRQNQYDENVFYETYTCLVCGNLINSGLAEESYEGGLTEFYDLEWWDCPKCKTKYRITGVEIEFHSTKRVIKGL